MFVFRFDAAFAQASASEFVADWLAGRLGAAGVVTGEDFTFGKARSGDIAALRRLGRANAISVDTVAPVSEDGAPVSSTRIREALRAGDCETATRLLTRPFAIESKVEPGDRRGRALGFPTANLPLANYLRPRYGIYAVRAELPDGRVHGGAANLGIRPTFAPPRELLEPFFLDFDGDLYGRTIEVELISFLRPEAKFETLESLARQMRADVDEARRRLSCPAG
jgi:riboflavin kinase / FMN adenylyltransferase